MPSSGTPGVSSEIEFAIISLSDNPNLSGERRLVPGTDIDFDDGGPNSTLTINSTATSSSPSLLNKNMTGSATTADGDQATTTTVAVTPDGYPALLVDGVQYPIGDGDKTKAAYFSGDGGTNARNIVDIAIGDTIHWNRTIATFDLSSANRLDLLMSA